MSRLPITGQDNGTWGDVLNDFISQVHASDGSLKSNTIGNLQIQDGVIASTKLTTAVQTSLTKANGSLQLSNNLNDLGNAANGRTNLGLSSLATMTPATLATDSALTGAYAGIKNGRPASNTWVALGDSITGYNGSEEQQNQGYWYQFVIRSLGRIRSAGNFSTGGFTLEQIEETHLPSVLALNPLPGAAIVFGGTNNTGALDAGVNGAGFNFTTARATLNRICAALRNKGIQPILVLIPPRTDFALVRQNVSLWNNYIYRLSQKEGYPVIDAFTPLVDIATGGYLSGYAVDNVHPSVLGHKAIADYAISNGLHLMSPSGNFFQSLWTDPYNLIGSGQGLFAIDTNSDGLSDGWILAGTGTSVTNSRVSPLTADNLKGSWQNTEQAIGGTGQKWIQFALGSSWTVGDKVSISARFQTEGFSGNVSNYSIGVLMNGSGSVVTKGIYVWTRDIADGLMNFDMTIPTGTTGMFFRVTIDGAAGQTAVAKVRLGQVTVKNLTTMGIASI